MTGVFSGVHTLLEFTLANHQYRVITQQLGALEAEHTCRAHMHVTAHLLRFRDLDTISAVTVRARQWYALQPDVKLASGVVDIN